MKTDHQCPTCKLVLRGEESPRTAAENGYVQLLVHFKTVHGGTGHQCGRRVEGFRFADDPPNSDFYRSDDNCCSYCGSLSPEEFFRRVDEGQEITPTDKEYKAYVGSNSKFYFQHLSEAQMKKFVDYINARKFRMAHPGYFYTRPFFVAR